MSLIADLIEFLNKDISDEELTNLLSSLRRRDPQNEKFYDGLLLLQSKFTKDQLLVLLQQDLVDPEYLIITLTSENNWGYIAQLLTPADKIARIELNGSQHYGLGLTLDQLIELLSKSNANSQDIIETLVAAENRTHLIKLLTPRNKIAGIDSNRFPYYGLGIPIADLPIIFYGSTQNITRNIRALTIEGTELNIVRLLTPRDQIAGTRFGNPQYGFGFTIEQLLVLLTESRDIIGNLNFFSKNRNKIVRLLTPTNKVDNFYNKGLGFTTEQLINLLTKSKDIKNNINLLFSEHWDKIVRLLTPTNKVDNFDNKGLGFTSEQLFALLTKSQDITNNINFLFSGHWDKIVRLLTPTDKVDNFGNEGLGFTQKQLITLLTKSQDITDNINLLFSKHWHKIVRLLTPADKVDNFGNEGLGFTKRQLITLLTKSQDITDNINLLFSKHWHKIVRLLTPIDKISRTGLGVPHHGLGFTPRQLITLLTKSQDITNNINLLFSEHWDKIVRLLTPIKQVDIHGNKGFGFTTKQLADILSNPNNTTTDIIKILSSKSDKIISFLTSGNTTDDLVNILANANNIEVAISELPVTHIDLSELLGHYGIQITDIPKETYIRISRFLTPSDQIDEFGNEGLGFTQEQLLDINENIDIIDVLFSNENFRNIEKLLTPSNEIVYGYKGLGFTTEQFITILTSHGNNIGNFLSEQNSLNIYRFVTPNNQIFGGLGFTIDQFLAILAKPNEDILDIFSDINLHHIYIFLTPIKQLDIRGNKGLGFTTEQLADILSNPNNTTTDIIKILSSKSDKIISFLTSGNTTDDLVNILANANNIEVAISELPVAHIDLSELLGYYGIQLTTDIPEEIYIRISRFLTPSDQIDEFGNEGLGFTTKQLVDIITSSEESLTGSTPIIEETMHSLFSANNWRILTKLRFPDTNANPALTTDEIAATLSESESSITEKLQILHESQEHNPSYTENQTIYSTSTQPSNGTLPAKKPKTATSTFTATNVTDDNITATRTTGQRSA